jgi:hypothetical protein
MSFYHKKEEMISSLNKKELIDNITKKLAKKRNITIKPVHFCEDIRRNGR